MATELLFSTPDAEQNYQKIRAAASIIEEAGATMFYGSNIFRLKKEGVF